MQALSSEKKDEDHVHCDVQCQGSRCLRHISKLKSENNVFHINSTEIRVELVFFMHSSRHDGDQFILALGQAIDRPCFVSHIPLTLLTTQDSHWPGVRLELQMSRQ